MRICLLTSQDLDADPFPEDDWPCDPRPFYPQADWDVATLKKRTAVRDVTRLVEKGYDLFFRAPRLLSVLPENQAMVSSSGGRAGHMSALAVLIDDPRFTAGPHASGPVSPA